MHEEKKNNIETNYSETLNGHRADRTVQILIEEIGSIRYVKHWAKKASVSKEWLKKEMKSAYSKTPKIILREVRYEIIVFLILKKGIDVTSLAVALESGVGETSDALYKFLSRHYDTTFSELKEYLLTKELNVSFSWLNWKELYYFYEYLNWRQEYGNGR